MSFLPDAWPPGATRLVARNADTGQVLATRVDVASSRLDRAIGLLARHELQPGEALLIVPSRGVHTWGMRFPIDLVALDHRGLVVDAVSSLRPWRLRMPRRGSIAVLELEAGMVVESGTRAGHRICFEVTAAEGADLRLGEDR